MDAFIGDVIVAYLERGIPADADIVDAVMRRAVGRRRAVRVRARWAIAGAIAAALLTSAVVLAVAGNLPIRLHLIPAQSDVSPTDKSSGTPSSAGPAQQAPHKVGPDATTLAAAEQAFGTAVLTPTAESGAVLDAVYFAAATPLPSDAKPGSPASRDTVELLYSYAGGQVDITEVRDPSPDALSVDALDQGGAQLKGTQGLGAASIQTVNGSEYAVGLSAGSSKVEWIIWKSSTGVVVSAHFDPAPAHDLAFALVGTFQ